MPYHGNPLASRSNALYASFLSDRASGRTSQSSRYPYELDIDTSDGYILSSCGEISPSEECYLPPSTHLDNAADGPNGSSLRRRRPPPPRKSSSSVNRNAYVRTPNYTTLRFSDLSSPGSPATERERFDKYLDAMRSRKEQEKSTAKFATAKPSSRSVYMTTSPRAPYHHTPKPSLTVRTTDLSVPFTARPSPLRPKAAGSSTPMSASRLARNEDKLIILRVTPTPTLSTPEKNSTSYSTAYSMASSTYYTPFSHSSSLEAYTPRPVAV
ncbi:uncharacterized protein STEHIDRAFT_172440 [Stereum hirsutum FP-91666 SS1]|uniref:uncharacterized protein n=1 Tax=Stereum hirsutum (strain FP-91666) TaxID=721885 RepID=UPI000444A2A8|nr:uncharacterized protein STEHIDRAFT_172440 [Stereum hirsutum FP-91666 SS1]EIM80711.1 hypothetical protein STEHIDRAFT_172440 [Stereum hirsutum FP-91666 SS1]